MLKFLSFFRQPAFMICGIPLVVGITAQAQEVQIIFNGQETLLPGGQLVVWGGNEALLDPQSKIAGKSASLRIGAKTEETQVWSGGRIELGKRNAIPIDLNQWDQLFLNAEINGGRTPQGKYEGGQPIQLSLQFSTADGALVSSPFLPIEPMLEGKRIDSDRETWQTLSIPFKNLRIPAAKKAGIVALSSVSVQFRGEPVTSGINIGSLNLGPQEFDPEAIVQIQEIPQPAADASLFPSIDKFKTPHLLPRNPNITIDAFGNYVFDGKPRFLIGAQMSERLRESYLPTPGYPDSLKWIYEQPLDYQNAQRLGLDSISYFVLPRWLPAIDSKYIGASEPPDGNKVYSELIRQAQLPLYVDFTCFPWTHGLLTQSTKIPDEAKNSGGTSSEGNHWVSYAALNPAGRSLYEAMFKDGARMVTENGGRPLFYELFNEPAYDDPSLYNRQRFIERLRKQYGTVEALNRVWRTTYSNFEAIANFKTRSDNPALFVEWSKFMEDAFVDLNVMGIKTIREIDKSNPNFTVQMLGGDYFRVLPKSNVNMYKLAEHMSVISTSTGGGIESEGAGGMESPPPHSIDVPYFSQRFDGLLSRHYFRSLAQGKPIHDGEMYVNARNIVDSIWLELARGGNASYVFEWSKRGFDKEIWGDPPTARGGQRLAEQMRWFMLNPYSVAPNKLAQINQVKREILAVDDIFVPRQNRSKAQIAVLLSNPTERYSQASGSATHNQIRNYSVALDFSHFDIDVLLEEQMAKNRLNDYKVLVAAGVENVQEGTSPRLKSWIEQGGTLVLGLEALQSDELGNPQKESNFLDLKLGKMLDSPALALTGSAPRAPWLPGEIMARPHREITSMQGWKTLAQLGGVPAILGRDLGRGHIYFINAKAPEYSLASILGGILQTSNISRLAELSRPDNGELQTNVELRKFSNATENLTGFMLYNWDKYPKEIRIRSSELQRRGVSLIDPLNRERFEVSDGSGTIWIPAATKRVLVVGNSDALNERFGPLQLQSPKTIETEVTRLLTDTTQNNNKTESVFQVDSRKLQTLDLRTFANRDFVDSVANDGKGGWTDQGENSLEGVEWGQQKYRGVLFDIIRPDMNEGHGAIILGSQKLENLPLKVGQISLREQVQSLFFLHTTAWTVEGQEAFKYLVHYNDGSQTEIPIRPGIEVGDWWIRQDLPVGMQAKVGWKNSNGRGFYIYEWKNPTPDNAISSIEIVSSNKATVPIIIGITAQLK